MKGLVESKVIPNVLKLIPAIFLIQLIDYIPTYQAFIDFILVIVIAYFALKISTSILDFINDLYNKYNKNARNKPIKGILTAIKIVIVVIVVIVVISNLLGESPTVILAGLGAMSAVLMLIFQDSILGLVAGFQMSANDLVRIGDWIEMPKYGVDGHVMDVTLTFIQVENWDNTTVTTLEVIDDKDRLYSYLHKGINEYSVITYMINSYLIGGFDNMLIYELERNTKIDTAIRKGF